MKYNNLSYTELLPLARAIAMQVPTTPPHRGFDNVTFSSDLAVVAKERPRDDTFHTPPKTAKYERAVRKEIKDGMRAAGFVYPFKFPVIMAIEIRQAMPKSWTDTKKYMAKAGLLFVTKRDLDNMVKAITDACNGVLLEDDRLIVGLNVEHRVSQHVGFTVKVTPAGLTRHEADRTEHIVKQLRSGKLT